MQGKRLPDRSLLVRLWEADDNAKARALIRPERAATRPVLRSRYCKAAAFTALLLIGDRDRAVLGIVTARATTDAEVRDHAGPDPATRSLRPVARALPPPAHAEHTPRSQGVAAPDPVQTSGRRRSLA